jgi:hypothetical protein
MDLDDGFADEVSDALRRRLRTPIWIPGYGSLPIRRGVLCCLWKTTGTAEQIAADMVRTHRESAFYLWTEDVGSCDSRMRRASLLFYAPREPAGAVPD